MRADDGGWEWRDRARELEASVMGRTPVLAAGRVGHRGQQLLAERLWGGTVLGAEPEEWCEALGRFVRVY